MRSTPIFRFVQTFALTVGAALFLSPSAPANAQEADPNVVYPASLFADLEYRYVGPSRGGRVTAVAGHADQPATFYMGATGGGVWKTTDYGRNWRPISDGFFMTGSIGAIDVADSDPDILYVGTGSDGLRSNVIPGVGVYKSTDAGKTWTHVGLEHTGHIGAVIIHPTDPNVVFVAAIGNAFGPNEERGVYRSTDGGASWEQVLFVSDSTGAVDLEFAPDDPTTIYAATWRAERKPWTIISGAREGGIYKSTDGGESWTKLTNGLPGDLVGKADLAVSAANPARVYALIEAEPGGGLYRSEDRGAHFELVNDRAALVNRPFYYINVDADPTDSDVVYVNTGSYWKSVDGGATFERRSTPHGDNHDMWINPNDPDVFVQSNDGGANVTVDGGRTWSTQHNQPTAELYQVYVDDAFPYRLYAGQQDNTTIAVPSLPPYRAPGGPTAHWEAIGGCETGPAVPKVGDPDIVYSNCKGRFGRYNRRTGQEQQYWVGAQYMYGHNPKDLIYRFQRVSPIEVTALDPGVVLHGSQYVHRSTDEGRTWTTISPDLTAFTPETQVFSGGPITKDITGEEFYSTLYALRVSPHDLNVIWAGANDGPVHVTRDGGRSWTDVTPAGLQPGGRVDAIEPSPHEPGKAYIAVLRYQLDDPAPYIYKTTDYGASWTLLTNGTNGIPDGYPTRVVREDPEREGLLYAGTEYGMYVSFDDGEHWQSLQQDLPVTPITDIKVHQDDLTLSTMGRGFWIMDDLGPLRQLDDRIAESHVHFFQPEDAHRLRYSSSSRAPADPEYRPVGAFVDYYLAEAVDDDMTLEIISEDGAIVRTFSGAGRDADAERPEEPGMGWVPFPSGSATNRLPTTAGMHRFVWDLRHPGPWSGESGRGGRGGPMVAPGTYTARLKVVGRTQERRFNVLIDPRVLQDGVTRADLLAQEELNLRVRDALSRARRTAQRIEELRGTLNERLNSLEEGSVQAGEARSVDEEMKRIQDALVSDRSITYPQRMLVDQIQYLYGMTTSADHAPGADAYQRIETLEGELEELIDRLESLIEARLSGLR
jgi:photosystem II stability/assembly factor-like uncharacterized protein